MKTKIPIEDVQIGDIINGKEVVDVLHRLHANYVRVVLKGGAIVDGYRGTGMPGLQALCAFQAGKRRRKIQVWTLQSPG